MALALGPLLTALAQEMSIEAADFGGRANGHRCWGESFAAYLHIVWAPTVRLQLTYLLRTANYEAALTLDTHFPRECCRVFDAIQVDVTVIYFFWLGHAHAIMSARPRARVM